MSLRTASLRFSSRSVCGINVLSNYSDKQIFIFLRGEVVNIINHLKSNAVHSICGGPLYINGPQLFYGHFVKPYRKGRPSTRVLCHTQPKNKNARVISSNGRNIKLQSPRVRAHKLNGRSAARALWPPSWRFVSSSKSHRF